MGNNKVNFYGEKFDRTIPRLEMVDINKTILELKRHIY